MQQFLFIDLFIDLFESAVHVSGNKFAHLQKQFLTVYTALVQCTDIAANRCWDGTLSSVGSNIGALYQSWIYSQKVLLRMGEFVARNM